MTTNNEITTVNNDELAALAAMTGASASSLTGSGDYIPQLKVNYDDEDEQHRELKTGLFFVTDQDVAVYAKTVTIRPLLHHFQWTKYDDVVKKVTNRTILITNFRQEPRDELGTVKCGKPKSVVLQNDPELKKKFEDVTCYRTVHVLVDYDGVDADGNKVSVRNVVACLRLKGANFAPFDEEFLNLMPKGSNLWDFSINLSTEKKKNGASTYYVIHFKGDFNTRLPVDSDIVDTITALHERIVTQNNSIEDKYSKARSLATLDASAMSAIDGDLASDFNEDE